MGQPTDFPLLDSNPLFDPVNTAAWYILQAETFATDRALWTPEGTMRVVPFLTRIGKELKLLLSVKRGRRASGSHEVTGEAPTGQQHFRDACRPRLPTQRMEPGRVRAGDTRARTNPAHARLSDMKPPTPREKSRGTRLAQPIHQLCLELGEFVIVEVKHQVEPREVADDFLLRHMRSSIAGADRHPLRASRWVSTRTES